MPSSLPPFSKRLLAWWDEHGRKDLPWQHPRTPYRVWVSEIMLQQTQVVKVIPYFERWMKEFPDLASLAAASLDDVLAVWAGLGYYARARNLHGAAQVCVKRFRGNVPDSFEDLKDLPGIGPSTANAIISQAFDRPAAVVDGNVKRVFARHLAVDGWPGDSKIHARLWRKAEKRLPKSRGADYTQAVMDLGAMVCTRARPRCDACPVSEDCRALTLNAVDQYPKPRPATRLAEKAMHVLILRDDCGRVLLERRPPAGIWGGLWSLPEGGSHNQILSSLGLQHVDSSAAKNGLPDREHRLTHVRLLIKPAMMTVPPGWELKSGGVQENSSLRFFDIEELNSVGIPKPITELLNQSASHQNNESQSTLPVAG